MRHSRYAHMMVQLITAASFLTACSEYAFVDCETYDYSDCVTQPASYGNLEVRVNFPNGEKSIPVILFKGSYPSSDTVFIDTIYSPVFSYSLEIGHTYSMTAEYEINGQRILTVDGDELSQKSYNVCDSVCWVNRDGSLDLRLKFDD